MKICYSYSLQDYSIQNIIRSIFPIFEADTQNSHQKELTATLPDVLHLQLQNVVDRVVHEDVGTTVDDQEELTDDNE